MYVIIIKTFLNFARLTIFYLFGFLLKVNVNYNYSKLKKKSTTFDCFLRKAAKATLVLIPLLGLHNLLLPVRPEDDSPMAEVYTFLIAISLSLQVR